MTPDLLLGLQLNIPRVLLRSAYVGFLGADAGLSGGMLPADWFDAMCEDDEAAADLEYQVNKRRG